MIYTLLALLAIFIPFVLSILLVLDVILKRLHLYWWVYFVSGLLGLLSFSFSIYGDSNRYLNIIGFILIYISMLSGNNIQERILALLDRLGYWALVWSGLLIVIFVILFVGYKPLFLDLLYIFDIIHILFIIFAMFVVSLLVFILPIWLLTWGQSTRLVTNPVNSLHFRSWYILLRTIFQFGLSGLLIGIYASGKGAARRLPSLGIISYAYLPIILLLVAAITFGFFSEDASLDIIEVNTFIPVFIGIITISTAVYTFLINQLNNNVGTGQVSEYLSINVFLMRSILITSVLGLIVAAFGALEGIAEELLALLIAFFAGISIILSLILIERSMGLGLKDPLGLQTTIVRKSSTEFIMNELRRNISREILDKKTNKHDNDTSNIVRAKNIGIKNNVYITDIDLSNLPKEITITDWDISIGSRISSPNDPVFRIGADKHVKERDIGFIKYDSCQSLQSINIPRKNLETVLYRIKKTGIECIHEDNELRLKECMDRFELIGRDLSEPMVALQPNYTNNSNVVPTLFLPHI
ncbi:hypothetical protein [Halalkalicoccus tibetensis]|uniref:Uncharacterized protein n=1 Tax=Halalkalicoccus tibetensis TaxID=175632 RepID=A0ABD5V436_9EURY